MSSNQQPGAAMLLLCHSAAVPCLHSDEATVPGVRLIQRQLAAILSDALHPCRTAPRAGKSIGRTGGRAPKRDGGALPDPVIAIADDNYRPADKTRTVGYQPLQEAAEPAGAWLAVPDALLRVTDLPLVFQRCAWRSGQPPPPGRAWHAAGICGAAERQMRWAWDVCETRRSARGPQSRGMQQAALAGLRAAGAAAGTEMAEVHRRYHCGAVCSVVSQRGKLPRLGQCRVAAARWPGNTRHRRHGTDAISGTVGLSTTANRNPRQIDFGVLLAPRGTGAASMRTMLESRAAMHMHAILW